jgi:penicillin-binding protein 1A
VGALVMRRTRRARARHHRVVVRVAIGLIALGLALAGGVAATVAVFVRDPTTFVSCNVAAKHQRVLGQESFVRAADGSLLGAVPATWHRQPVSLRRMSPWLPKATVDVEDRRFWVRHGALDPEAITRAAIANLRAHHTVQGGSTITQQLARDRYLTHAPATLSRKLEEACLAAQLEHRLPKRAILRAYLNGSFYGHYAYGVQAAARTYFGRSARRVTLAQAALIAGLPQAPSRYDPLIQPRSARARRNEVLAAMLAARDISRRRFRAAKRSPLRLAPGHLYNAIHIAPFFDPASRELIDRYGKRRARHGGLRVVTTLDPRLERQADQAIRGWLGPYSGPGAALVAIDPASGAIRALSTLVPGGERLRFNLATQSHRQAGSAFKTFALVAALEAGIGLNSVWNGPSSLTVTDRRCLNAGAPWVVHNYADEGHGTMSLLQATAFSVNTIYAQVGLRVGPARIVAVAHRMGVTSPLQPVCSITLGPEGVSPLEMTDAFATLAARGIHHAATTLQRVTTADGRRIGGLSGHGTRVLSPGVVQDATLALGGVVRAGTGTAAYFGRPAAGKTGTAENFKDAWFCGFVPQLATCVWVGYPGAEIPLLNLDGFPQVFGGSIPARIWHDFMLNALAGTPVRPLPTPSAGQLAVGSRTTTSVGPTAGRR